MIKPVRYQKGHLYEDHGAWFVRYRLEVREADGSTKVQRVTERLGSLESIPTKTEAEALRSTKSMNMTEDALSLWSTSVA